MTLDPVLLSRLQWVWVISWHILLPAFTVGLASYVAVLEGFYFFTERPIWLRLSTFWTRLLAVSFGMGVVSGIIMPFQFGTNWSRFSDITGNVISPLLAYEGLMAFFLEASFLGVLLFGRRLVPRWMHFFAGVMVAVGTLFSSFWILVDQQLDADAGGLRDRRWPLLSHRLDGDRLQSVVSVPPHPQRQCVLHHDRVRGDGSRGLSAAPGEIGRRSQDHDQHGARSPDHPGAAAIHPGRPARPQHP